MAPITVQVSSVSCGSGEQVGLELVPGVSSLSPRYTLFFGGRIAVLDRLGELRRNFRATLPGFASKFQNLRSEFRRNAVESRPSRGDAVSVDRGGRR